MASADTLLIVNITLIWKHTFPNASIELIKNFIFDPSSWLSIPKNSLRTRSLGLMAIRPQQF
jgi:hypothetical protein